MTPTTKSSLRPRLAASIVVAKVSDAGVWILMGKRSAGHVFLPGYHVFPGGAVERNDKNGVDFLDRHGAEQLTASFRHFANPYAKAQAVARAALRELAEETGYRLRAEIASCGIVRPLGRALTPPGHVRRYDTRFFIADGNAFECTNEETDQELLNIEWVCLPAPKDLKIHHITAFMIEQAQAVLKGDASNHLPCLRERYGRLVIERE